MRKFRFKQIVLIMDPGVSRKPMIFFNFCEITCVIARFSQTNSTTSQIKSYSCPPANSRVTPSRQS